MLESVPRRSLDLAPLDPEALRLLNELLLSDWIVAQGLTASEPGPLIDGTCRRLELIGVRVWRMHLMMLTLYPGFASFGATWLREHELQLEESEGPLRAMLECGILSIRRQLERPAAELEFPELRAYHAQGGTEWLARLVPFGDGSQPTGLPGMAVSWVSDRPGGFSEAEVGTIERLVPLIALACYRIALQNAGRKLLDTYMGAGTGRRVLAGQVERGAASRLSAVVFLADLRGFTQLADETPGEQLLVVLNDFLGNLTDIVEAHGGHVLKFTGDGLLAVFSLEVKDPATICSDVLAAAQLALEDNARLNGQRSTAGALPLVLDIAVHVGQLMYGNVGSHRRLDFTVIGSAVNEASRIEALCEPLGQRLLISASFAALYGRPLRSLGHHRLRGVANAQELFTLP